MRGANPARVHCSVRPRPAFAADASEASEIPVQMPLVVFGRPLKFELRRFRISQQGNGESPESPRLLNHVPSEPPHNSSGVQIVGGSKPESRQTFSIKSRIAAFAICLKFQVTRNCTPLVAAMEICTRFAVLWKEWPRRTSAAAITHRTRRMGQ